jgi:hypothetical protein
LCVAACICAVFVYVSAFQMITTFPGWFESCHCAGPPFAVLSDNGTSR